MKPSLTILALLCTAIVTQAQTADTTKRITLHELVTTANKFPENRNNMAQQVQLINRKEIAGIDPQTTAHMLEQTGSVFVQRSQAGGGSPVLRGFEASRVLLVIDGVRMNNAIYRAGHLQNVITVDNNILDNAEILYGPSSTLYGSDALGGVIVFNTLQPQLSVNNKTLIKGGAATRFSGANNERTGHAHINIGGRKWASLTSVTYSAFGDLRQGAVRNAAYDSLGLRPYYVAQVGGKDSIVANDDIDKQRYSGYNQLDVLQKLMYKQSATLTHTLNLQYSTSSNIPRYDRLTDIRNGKLRFAEWYYGPQDRLMAAYQLKKDRLGVFDNMVAGVSYQKIGESRHQRDYNKPNLQSRTENVDVLGYNIDLRKMMGAHELTIGSDGQYNQVNSTAREENVSSGETKPLDTRYPDGGSKMGFAAVYAQHIYKVKPNKFVVNDGVRLNYVSLGGRFDDKTFFPFPYNEAMQQHLALSGNLGFVYMPATRWRISMNGATGFRAPNVDELAKVFESNNSVLVLPNPNLKPEYTYSLDMGIAYVIEHRLKLELNAYTTYMDNAILISMNGDSTSYNGNMVARAMPVNKAHAILHGASAGITALLTTGLNLSSTITYTYGRAYDATGAEAPLDHIPPVFGRTGISYARGRFNSEVFALYSGWKRAKDYSPSGEDNLNYATPDGMPGWYALNLRLGYKLHPNLLLQGAVENILDHNYRVFASGISAPGRNLVLSARLGF
jgi:hemoglobin/transferrin/lactoferrin receptor protein